MSTLNLRAGLIDIFAGAVCSVLSVAYCLSYAALIFTGPLEHYLSYGIAVTFLSAAIGGTIVALRSSLPFAIAGPDSSISVVIAALVTTIVQRLVAGGATDLLGPVLIAMSLATGLTGLLLCVLGFTHAGRAIRFVPYPVIGGFLGATGWLMVTGAIQIVTNQRPTLDNLGAFFDAAIAARIAPGVVCRRSCCSCCGGDPRIHSSCPACCWPHSVVAHIVRLVTGMTLADAQAAGWMFHLQPAAGLSLPWKPAALADFPWSSLPSLAGDVLAVMFVTIATLLLNTTGIEIATRTEANIERDLKVLGFANVATAALGGYVSCTSLSRSILVRTVGSHKPPRRADGRRHLGRGAHRRSVVPRLCAEIHSRRPVVLSRRRPRLSMARAFVAAAVAARISVAARNRGPDHLFGLHRRRADRHRHRLRHLCAERQPRQRDQVQLRRFGISLLARSRAL